MIEAPGGRAAILDAARIEAQTASLVDDGAALAASATTPEQLDAATRRPNARRIRKAVSFAAFTAFPILFPDCRASFAAELDHLGYRQDDVSAHALIGRLAGLAFVAGRLHDGANQLGDYADTTSYEPVNTPDLVVDPWRWQPLRVPLGDPGGSPQVALTPQWGEVRPFDARVMTLVDEVPPPSRDHDRTVDDMLDKSANLTDRQKVIAEYWADGPRSELPPGHWNLFAQWVSRRHGQSLADDVRMFFALNAAMLDASIAAWEVKYRTDFARPVTTIRTLLAGETIAAWAGPGQGTQMIPAKAWIPYQPVTFPTRPFPEYLSGHSTFSAAGATVLERFSAMKGRDATTFDASVTLPAGWSRVEPGAVPAQDVTLRWPTFDDAADEAGISRRYGGIHWVDGDLNGRRLGRRIGRRAFGLAVVPTDIAYGVRASLLVRADGQEALAMHRRHPRAKLTIEGRRLLVGRVRRLGWPVARAAEAQGVSRATAHKWLARYDAEGDAGLADRSSRPHRSPTRLSPAREAAILARRDTHLEGPHTIGWQLGESPSTVSAVLTRHGRARLCDIDRATRTVVRYERDRPGELVHVDVKKQGRIPDGGGWRMHGRGPGVARLRDQRPHATRDGRPRLGYDYLHIAVDDRSRVAYVEPHDDERKDTAAAFMRRAIAWFADHGITIERVMTDNGSCYRSRVFRDVLADAGVTHKRTRPYRPQTNGKAERFNLTLKLEWAYHRPYTSNQQRIDALDAFVHRYNHHRPHYAHTGGTPMSTVNNLPAKHT